MIRHEDSDFIQITCRSL